MKTSNSERVCSVPIRPHSNEPLLHDDQNSPLSPSSLMGRGANFKITEKIKASNPTAFLPHR